MLSSIETFLFGFFSAVAGLIFIVFYGAKKGRETLSAKLAELNRQHREELAKAVRAAADLDATRVTSNGVMVSATPSVPMFIGANCKVTLNGLNIFFRTSPTGAGNNSGSSTNSSGNDGGSNGSSDGSASSTAANPSDLHSSSVSSGGSTSSGAQSGSSGGASSGGSSLDAMLKRAAMTEERTLVTLHVGNVTGRLVSRFSVSLEPIVGQYLCEINDSGTAAPPGSGSSTGGAATADDTTANGGGKTIKIKTLVLKFATAREADRWYTVLTPAPLTGEWQKFVRSLVNLDAFNLLVGRIIYENNSTSALNDFIGAKITKKLKSVRLPKPLSGILELVHVSFGRGVPLFTNVNCVAAATNGEIGFDVDLTYTGGFTLQLCASVDIGTIHLPSVIVTVNVQELRGRLHVSIGAPPSHNIWIGFHDEPQLKISIKQEVHTAQPQNSIFSLSNLVSKIPDLSAPLTDLIKTKLFEDMILPQMDDVPIPNVAPTPPDSPEVGPQAGAAEKKALPQWDGLPPATPSSAAGAAATATSASTPAAAAPATKVAPATPAATPVTSAPAAALPTSKPVVSAYAAAAGASDTPPLAPKAAPSEPASTSAKPATSAAAAGAPPGTATPPASAAPIDASNTAPRSRAASLGSSPSTNTAMDTPTSSNLAAASSSAPPKETSGSSGGVRDAIKEKAHDIKATIKEKLHIGGGGSGGAQPGAAPASTTAAQQPAVVARPPAYQQPQW